MAIDIGYFAAKLDDDRGYAIWAYTNEVSLEEGLDGSWLHGHPGEGRVVDEREAWRTPHFESEEFEEWKNDSGIRESESFHLGCVDFIYPEQKRHSKD